MPIRFRKSVKIAPGTRLNLSKKGISASVGAGGLRASTGKSGNCLYNIFVLPFVLIFQLYALLFKGIIWLWKKATATPQSRRISLIVVGVMFIMGLCSLAVSAITGSGKIQPTQDTSKVKSIALTQAWIALTQTAISLPTSTTSLIPTETLTASPIPTITDTSTPFPTATVFIPSTQPPANAHPPGTSGQCVDGNYTKAAHKQGACSSHGGIAVWWGP